MKRYRVEVTAEDIANGTPRRSDECPVACALSREHGKASVSSVSIGFTDGPRWAWFTPPKEATAFIRAFDNGEAVEPITFYLEDAR